MRKTLLVPAAICLAAISCTKPSGNSGFGTGVIITEINGSEDYIEIYNPTSQTQSLEKMKIRRYRMKDGAEDTQTIWRGAPGTSLEPGEYRVMIYGDGGELENRISSHKNAVIWINYANGDLGNSFQRGVKSIGWGEVNMQKTVEPNTEKDYSYALIDGEWVYSKPSPGEANGVAAGPIDQTMLPVAINEIDFDNSKVELYNYGDKTVNLNGLQLRWSRIKDGAADNRTIWEAVGGSIEPGAFMVISTKENLASYKDRNIHLKLRNKLKTDFTGEYLEYDDVKRGEKGSGWTLDVISPLKGQMIRVPDGTGEWTEGSASLGQKNQ